MPTELVRSIESVRARLAAARGLGHAIGLVPTMGALHTGHLSLVDRARQQCECVVVSVFVNPMQFDRADDFTRYPRDLASDLDACGAHHVDIVFAPSAEEMYPRPARCVVEVTTLKDHLCGQHRPGHFTGVATVVTKLLQIVQPSRAYFGRKDAQQLAVVRRLVDDLNIPVEIVGVETVREEDGLALSSRNQLLDPRERAMAPSLYQALREAERLIESGLLDAATVAREAASQIRDNPALELEYLEIVDPDEVQPVSAIDGPVLVAGALWVGSTRLIDNILVTPPRR